jgi:hypothetical protein
VCFVFTAARFELPERKHNTAHWDSPMFPHYSKRSARIKSFATWPATSKQNLSNAGFFYAGKKHFLNKSLFITTKYIFVKPPNVQMDSVLQEKRTIQVVFTAASS